MSFVTQDWPLLALIAARARLTSMPRAFRKISTSVSLSLSLSLPLCIHICLERLELRRPVPHLRGRKMALTTCCLLVMVCCFVGIRYFEDGSYHPDPSFWLVGKSLQIPHNTFKIALPNHALDEVLLCQGPSPGLCWRVLEYGVRAPVSYGNLREQTGENGFPRKPTGSLRCS